MNNLENSRARARARDKLDRESSSNFVDRRECTRIASERGHAMCVTRRCRLIDKGPGGPLEGLGEGERCVIGGTKSSRAGM